jgi:hypothetical protein
MENSCRVDNECLLDVYLFLLEKQIASYPDCDINLLIRSIGECPEGLALSVPSEFWYALLNDARSDNTRRIVLSVSLVLGFLSRFPSTSDLIYDIFCNISVNLMWSDDSDVRNAGLAVLTHLFFLYYDDIAENIRFRIVQCHKANISDESRFRDKAMAIKFYRDCCRFLTEREMENIFDPEFMEGVTDDLLDAIIGNVPLAIDDNVVDDALITDDRLIVPD